MSELIGDLAGMFIGLGIIVVYYRVRYGRWF